MKPIYHTFISLTVLALICMASCVDDPFNSRETPRQPTNMIHFDVSSGFSKQLPVTRTNDMDSDEDDGLSPMILCDGKDTLYLHRYVAPESERATGKNHSLSTRMTPVNNVADFKTINGTSGFKVMALFAPDQTEEEEGDVYFPLSTAYPLERTDASDAWYIKPYQYWPANRELCFHAFAPADAQNLLVDLNLPTSVESDQKVSCKKITFSYEVPKSSEPTRIDAEKQPDLMFATTFFNHIKEDNTHDDLAPLNFRHALSAIKFAVGDVLDGEIVDISIIGVAGSGKCTFTIDNNDGNGSGEDSGNNPETIAEGNSESENDGIGSVQSPFKWEVSSDKNAEYIQTFNYTVTDPYPNIPGKGKAPIINDQEVNNQSQLNKTFMLIPQVIPDEALLKITFKIKKESNKNNEGNNGESEGGNDNNGESVRSDENNGEGNNESNGEVVEYETKTMIGKLKTSEIPEWLPGQEYVYTISTSAENWEYMFEVIGSRQEEKTFDTVEQKWIEGKFVPDKDVIEIGSGVTEGSFYTVKSYRYRLNNHNKVESVPWTAVATEGTNTVPEAFEKYKDKIPNMTLDSDKWLLENWIYKYDGKETLIKCEDLSFEPQYIATDWKGDWDMRAKKEKYNRENTVDLSMVYGERNTANCYVVNAGGWYSIPLFYGSSIKNGQTDESTYTTNPLNFEYNTFTYYTLMPFLDYAGNPITNAEIPSENIEDAILVWQDAYGIIDEYWYDKQNKQIVFHVNHTFLQQANCVLAIRDKVKNIVWSWHIWVTEHWVNEDLKLGVRSEDREADVKCEAEKEGYGPFYLAPYNLGWCDPKNVAYLRRSGTMTFTQTDGDGKKIKEKTLDVIQREDIIEYWIGNSTYYQFGRKDPMVGFINNESKEKYNFGEMPYAVNQSDFLSIQKGINNPNVFYDKGDDPEMINKYNLWNNYKANNTGDVLAEGVITTVINGHEVGSGNSNMNENFAYSAVKTIYDPSPAGYVVPPINFFQVFGKGNPNTTDFSKYITVNDFEKVGEMIKINNIPTSVEAWDLYFDYKASPLRNHSKPYSVVFNVTGQRRYWNTNMNPNTVYLWGNIVGFYQLGGAFCFALGYDTPGDFTFNTYFQGAASIARPIRCIKEPTPAQNQ